MSAGSACLAGRQHLRARSRRRCTVTPGGSGDAHRAADQRHPRAQRGERGGDGVALAAGGAVGDVAHRVDRLVRRAAGDQRVLAGERFGRRRQQRLDRGEDGGRLGQAAGAEFVAGHRALVRPDHQHAARRAASPCWPASRRAATCARSSPAPPAPACRSPAAAWRPDRRPGPAAIFARMSAVAGATTTRSALRDSWMCPISLSSVSENRSV